MKPRHGMVVSAHPMASEAGAAVLRKGGNAIDAAVATSLVLGAVEPAFSGIGGGGFAIIHRHTGEDVALDYRETAPSGSWASMFEDGSDKNRVGPLAIATPGALAGHGWLLEDYGTMKFADLAGPAIRAAKSGVRSSLSRRILRDKKSTAFKKISRFEESRKAFLKERKLPQLSATLSGLAVGGPGKFYERPLAEKIVSCVRDLGGLLSKEDFEGYVPKQRRPATGDYDGYSLISMPPPSAGGTLLLSGLQLAQELGREQGVRNELLVTAMTMKSVLKEKWRFGDPDFVEVPGTEFLRKLTMREAESLGGRTREPSVVRNDEGRSTSHFSIMDREGNAISVTETIECYYGSGVTVPDLGVVMNDEMHDFDVVSGRPNSVAPLKRPASSMTPTMLSKDGVPWLILGGAGSGRIISSVFQTIRNVVDEGLNLARAVSNPRIHPAGELIEIEGGVSPEDVRVLRQSGFKLHRRLKNDIYFGGVHAIMIDPTSGKVTGAADPRRLGSAVSDQ